jgi:hypothetical protein
MNKHFFANKYLPIALALAAFTAAGTAPVFAQQSSSKQSISASGYSAYTRTVVPPRVGPDPLGLNGWFDR